MFWVDDDKWLQVSLIVDGEMAEAVAEVLSRYCENGVAIESTEIQDDPDGEGKVIGALQVTGYLPYDSGLDAKRTQVEEALWYLGCIRSLPSPEFHIIQNTNWMENWKSHFRPILIGQQMIIVPVWLDVKTDDRIPIYMDPGMAFGTGTHPTTQLCIEFLEKFLERGNSLIDVGCGSGILSLAGLKLGAGQTLAVDLDSTAVTNARRNAEINDLQNCLEFGIGSVPEILTGEFSIRKAAVVVVNILANVILELFDSGLGELVESGGKIILSGILDSQLGGITSWLESHDWVIVDVQKRGDWVALVAGKALPNG